MLNELYMLSGTLEIAEITPHYWYPNFGKIPKGVCYRVTLSQNGSISDITPVDEDLRKRLRKYEPSNGHSFPGFNIQPLYRITDANHKKFIKKWLERTAPVDIEILKSWCVSENRNWDERLYKKLKKCLKAIPKELLQRIGEIPDEYDGIKKLSARVLAADFLTNFRNRLEYFLWEKIKVEGRLKDLIPILLHEGKPKLKAENDRGKISIFLDVQDWINIPVMSEKSIGWINERLVLFEKNTVKRNSHFDAFYASLDGSKQTLPTVELPFIGNVTLRAMAGESPCQNRYGTIDAMSFPIGYESRKRSKSALEWLSDESREGQTWGRADGKELIFAYPSILPPVPPKLASCFGANKTDDAEARFARYAEDVIDSLKGLAPNLKDVGLRVFSLRKMDTARTKVVFHRNYSAQRLEVAAKEWIMGCTNIPKIKIKAWSKEKGQIFNAEPEAPFPLQISNCLNRIWKLDGTSKTEISAICKSDGIELLLEQTAILGRVPYFLATAIQNSKGLFISLGQEIHAQNYKPINLDKLNKHKQLMPSILGLLLWKLSIRKEVYMKNPPYLIGRMLKIADELHALYCKEVRGDKKPPQLLGNALMAGALNSPTQALGQLALRIIPYLGWARTNTTGSFKLSRYFLKEFKLIGDELRGKNLPKRLDDTEKAQVLLGYISSGTLSDDNTTL